MAENTDAMPRTQTIKGLPFPSGAFRKEIIETCLDHVPQDDDIILASYPKTGSTWLQYIILQILSKGEYFPDFNDVTFKIVPYIELAGLEPLKSMKEPRIYKHHIPYNMMQKNNKSKVLYTYRNPEDTVVSYIHFMQSMNELPIPFESFFENFVSGKLAYGQYFKHVLSFYDHHEDENLLMVSYEKMKSNPKAEILRIAKFISQEHYQSLIENDTVMENILEHTSFNYMKQNLTLIDPKYRDKEEKKKVDFFRKGIVGDGKNELSDEQCHILKVTAEKVLGGTDIFKEWYGE